MTERVGKRREGLHVRRRGLPRVFMQNVLSFNYFGWDLCQVATVNLPREQVQHGLSCLGSVMNRIDFWDPNLHF